MSYNANLEIVVALNELFLFNLRKQGFVRFKMTLFKKTCTEELIAKQKTASKKNQAISYEDDYAKCDPYNIARKSDLIKEHQYFLQGSQVSQLGRKPNKHTEGIHSFTPTSPPVATQHFQQSKAKGYSFAEQASRFKQQTNQLQMESSNNRKDKILSNESYIDHNCNSYYSKVLPTKYAEQTHLIEQSVFFKAFVDVNEMENTELMIKVDLMFCASSNPNMHQQSHSDYSQQNNGLSEAEGFKTLGSFVAKIRKLSPISSYLPITFDEFQGFNITATYHTTIMEFKFQPSVEETDLKKEEFESYEQYLQAATSNFCRAETKNFYMYYREFLERELFHIQERHSDLIRVLNLPLQYPFFKVAPNTNLQASINNLPHHSGNRPIDHSIQSLISHSILQDFLSLKAIIYQKWNDFVLFITEYTVVTTAYYQQQYNSLLKERFKGNVFSHKIEEGFDWTYAKYEDSGKKYLQLAENDRKKNKDQELWKELFPIEDQSCFHDEKKYIKIFEEVFQTHSRNSQNHFTRRIKKFASLQQQTMTGQSNKSEEDFPFHKNKPFISNIRKSSMVTVGQNEQPSFFKEKKGHIELGSGFSGGNDRFVEPQYQKVPPNYARQNLQIGPGNFSNFNEVKGIRPQPQQFSAKNSTIISNNPSEAGDHIIVLVHGYQASRQDFQVLKTCLEIRFKVKVYISNCNQGRTDDNIEAMGKRLAIELARYFENIEFGSKTKVSFIGHSLGGIIIRSALGFLSNISGYLHTYMSFSSPHLGYLYEPSRIVKAGLWFMNSWQGSKSMNQICMKDTEDLRTSYFFRLSENGSLNEFKNLVLVSSSQDGYIPYQSARIEKNHDILYNKLSDSISRNVIIEMVDNILGDIKAKEISRLNVIFHIEDKNMDSYIGRTAHVKYLSDLKFLKMFSIVFEKFFN